MLRPLDDLLEQNRHAPPELQVTEERFLPSAWRHNHGEDGTVFGIPQIIDAQCLIWNLDILQEAAQTDEEFARSLPAIQTAASTTHGFALTPCATGTTSDASRRN